MGDSFGQTSPPRPIPASQSLRAEADAILQGGLCSLLEDYGRTMVHGSYQLDLMAWRDLDLYVSPPTLRLDSFFELGARAAALLQPHRMHFRDERVAPSEGLPQGLYWGIYLRDQPWGAWKIDLWAMSPEELHRLTVCENELAVRLTPDLRPVILAIKSVLCHHPEYRRGFGAKHIYDAVLNHGVRDLAAFAVWLQQQTGLRIEA